MNPDTIKLLFYCGFAVVEIFQSYGFQPLNMHSGSQSLVSHLTPFHHLTGLEVGIPHPEASCTLESFKK